MVAAAERDTSVASRRQSLLCSGSVISSDEMLRRRLFDCRDARLRKRRCSGRRTSSERRLIPLMRIDRLVGWPSLFRVDRSPPWTPIQCHHTTRVTRRAASLRSSERTLRSCRSHWCHFATKVTSATGFASGASAGGTRRGSICCCGSGRDSWTKTRCARGIRHTAWKWTRSMAWRSLKQLGHSDAEFCLYQSLCSRRIFVPRLREAGYTSDSGDALR